MHGELSVMFSLDNIFIHINSIFTFLFLGYIFTLMILSNIYTTCFSSLVTNSQFWDKGYPTITFILGTVITYFLSVCQRKKEENKELARYEYSLIIDILEVLKMSEKEKRRKEIVNLYNEEKRKSQFVKLENYTIINGIILNIIEKDDVDTTELKKIKWDLETKI